MLRGRSWEVLDRLVQLQSKGDGSASGEELV